MDAYNQYQTQAVTTATPGQLVAMLYQGALGAITRAEQVLRGDGRDRFEVANRELSKAHEIVSELTVSLDHDAGGQIAANLAALYDFCADRLIRANLHKDPELLPAVKQVVADLAETWDEMLKISTTPIPAAVG